MANVYLRYVDDIFAVFDTVDVECFENMYELVSQYSVKVYQSHQETTIYQVNIPFSQLTKIICV